VIVLASILFLEWLNLSGVELQCSSVIIPVIPSPGIGL
jgi:hypothetical protein